MVRDALSRFAFVACLAWLVSSATACDDRTKADDGRDAALQVAGAQFFRQDMPADQGGPAVKTVTISPSVPAGATDRRCGGDAAPESAAIALGLAGDVGYWIVPTSPPDVTAPGFPTFAAEVSFARTLGAGSHDLVVRAVDDAGRFGPAQIRAIDVRSAIPEGRLVISLSWTNDADLDLHVVDPNGVEVFARNPSSYEPPPPGAPKEPPGTPHDGGVLDFDSNGECVADGLRAEHVVWTDAPPRGHYVVRVDAASLCGLPAAYWTVEAFLDGARLAGSRGIATPDDTRFPHERGAGVLALEVDVP
jgi:hypothetical protein